MAFNRDEMPKIPKNYHADQARVVLAEQVTHAPELIKMASESGRLLEDRPRSTLWKVDGDVRDESDTTGLFATTFIDRDRKTVVIAYRGADQGIDTIGPVKELLVDGELMSLAGLPISPKGDGPKEQVADLQRWVYEKALGQDQWHPQFDAALDYARSVRDEYQPQGYTVEVTGYGLGASEAQLAAHTLGLGGAAFEPYGAKNLTESAGYKAWLSHNGIETPPGAPARDEHDILGMGFVNYVVNRSALSEKSGPHLGGTEDVSAFAGREGAASYGRYAVSTLDSIISDNPVGDVLAARKLATGAVGGALGKTILSEAAESSAKQGIDVADRRSLDRLVRVFDEAARTGDLPQWGATDQTREIDARLAQSGPSEPTDKADFPSDHPHAALYAKVRSMLPDSVSDAHAAQITLATCRDADIGGPQELLKIVMERNHAFVGGTIPGHRAAVDLSQPPPPIADTAQQLRDLDQQQLERTAQQELAQAATRDQPVQRSL